jgi:heme exporter protein A
MLSIEQLSMIRGERCLFRQLNFSLPSSEVLFIHGPNGAGKSTLLALLCARLTPTTGQITWEHLPINKNRDAYYHAMTFVGHEPGLKQRLTVKENIQWRLALAASKANRPLLTVLKQVGLNGYADRFVADLSFGQRRRVVLAALLLLQKQLWILDEPLSGLDKEGVALTQSLIEGHVKQGGSVILTSHQPIQVPDVSLRTLALVNQARECA